MLQGPFESVEGSCKACGSHDEEEEEANCEETVATNRSTSCSCPDNTKQGENTHTSQQASRLVTVFSVLEHKNKKYSSISLDLSPNSNGSDCGYSSSIEGSEMGSREGSEVACSEGICNHDEAGQV